MNLTSYTGLFSVGPVGRATWASFGALTLKFTFVVVVIGLKRHSTLSSVLNPVDNTFSFYGVFFWFSQMAAQILGFRGHNIVFRITYSVLTG